MRLRGDGDGGDNDYDDDGRSARAGTGARSWAPLIRWSYASRYQNSSSTTSRRTRGASSTSSTRCIVVCHRLELTKVCPSLEVHRTLYCFAHSQTWINKVWRPLS